MDIATEEAKAQRKEWLVRKTNSNLQGKFAEE